MGIITAVNARNSRKFKSIIMAPTAYILTLIGSVITLAYGNTEFYSQQPPRCRTHNACGNGKQDGLCFMRTCDQIISGRKLNYGRTLQINLNEEYLNASDL